MVFAVVLLRWGCDSQKTLGLGQQKLYIVSVGDTIHPGSARNSALGRNSLARPAVFVDEGNDIESEPVRIQHFVSLNFIHPKWAILAELVPHDSSSKDSRCGCLGVEEKKIATL